MLTPELYVQAYCFIFGLYGVQMLLMPDKMVTVRRRSTVVPQNPFQNETNQHKNITLSSPPPIRLLSKETTTTIPLALTMT